VTDLYQARVCVCHKDGRRNSGEDLRETEGLVFNFPHPCVNKAKKYTLMCQWLPGKKQERKNTEHAFTADSSFLIPPAVSIFKAV